MRTSCDFLSDVENQENSFSPPLPRVWRLAPCLVECLARHLVQRLVPALAMKMRQLRTVQTAASSSTVLLHCRYSMVVPYFYGKTMTASRELISIRFCRRYGTMRSYHGRLYLPDYTPADNDSVIAVFVACRRG